MRCDILEKCDDIVIRALLDLVDVFDDKRRLPSNGHRVFPGNRADFGHAFTGQQLDLEPDFQLALLTPKRAHLRQGVAVNHIASVAKETRPRPIEILLSSASTQR